MLSEGDQAPAFELHDQDGETVSLSDYRGERVVLYFYPKVFTGGCTTEAVEFRDAHDEYEARGVEVVGISTDTVEDVAEFHAEHDLPFTLLADPDEEVAKAYGVFKVAEMRGETWRIADRVTFVVGPDGTVEAVYEEVDPEGHPEEILDDLEAPTA